MTRITTDKPEADGICYDDTLMLSPRARRILSARGLVFQTEFQANGLTYGGMVIAGNRQSAHEIADARGLGEQIVGPLVIHYPKSARSHRRDRCPPK